MRQRPPGFNTRATSPKKRVTFNRSMCCSTLYEKTTSTDAERNGSSSTSPQTCAVFAPNWRDTLLAAASASMCTSKPTGKNPARAAATLQRPQLQPTSTTILPAAEASGHCGIGYRFSLPRARRYKFPFVFTTQSFTKASMDASWLGPCGLAGMFLGTGSRRTASVKIGISPSTRKMCPCSQTNVSSCARRVPRSKGQARIFVNGSQIKSIHRPSYFLFHFTRSCNSFGMFFSHVLSNGGFGHFMNSCVPNLVECKSFAQPQAR